MNHVRNEAHFESRRLKNAPQDVVVPVELLWTAVAEMRECRGAGLQRLHQPFAWRVGMPDAPFDAERDSARDRCNRIQSLGCYRHQDRIIAADFPQLIHVLRFWIEHERRIVSATKAGLSR